VPPAVNFSRSCGARSQACQPVWWSGCMPACSRSHAGRSPCRVSRNSWKGSSVSSGGWGES
jgi:hypothetical protein